MFCVRDGPADVKRQGRQRRRLELAGRASAGGVTACIPNSVRAWATVAGGPADSLEIGELVPGTGWFLSARRSHPRVVSANGKNRAWEGVAERFDRRKAAF